MICKFCNDPTEYEWFENHDGKWRLGTKIDVNNYRLHECKKEENNDLRFPQRKGFHTFECLMCGYITRLSKKHFTEKENYCLDCRIKLKSMGE